MRIDAVVRRRVAALGPVGAGAAGAQLLDRALDVHAGPGPAPGRAAAGGAGAPGRSRPPRSEPDRSGSWRWARPARRRSRAWRTPSRPASRRSPLRGCTRSSTTAAALPVELDAAKFETYLKEEGLEAISAARARQGKSAAGRQGGLLALRQGAARGGRRRAPARGSTASSASGSSWWRRRTPIRSPGGGELPVRLLYEGKPLAGALVMALQRGRPGQGYGPHGRQGARHPEARPPRLLADQGGAHDPGPRGRRRRLGELLGLFDVCPPVAIAIFENGGSFPGAMDERETEDRDLMSRVAARDGAAFARLFEIHAPLTLGLLLRILGRRSEAEEVLQEVFLQVWMQADRYDEVRSTPRGWILMLARSRALDRLRRRDSARRREEAAGEEAGEAIPPVGTERLETLEREAPGRLRPRGAVAGSAALHRARLLSRGSPTRRSPNGWRRRWARSSPASCWE